MTKKEIANLKKIILNRLNAKKGIVHINTYNSIRNKVLYDANTTKKLEKILDQVENFSEEFRTIESLKNKVKIEEPRNEPVILTDERVLDAITYFEQRAYTFEGINDTNTLYNNIIDRINKIESQTGKFISFISLVFSNYDDSKHRFISLNINNLESYELFIAKLNEIISGNYMTNNNVGSDAIAPDLKLTLNYFTISFFKGKGYGKSDKMLFNTINLESKSNSCGFECLKKMGYEVDESQKKNFNDFNFMKNYCLESGIKIALNTFKLNVSMAELRKRGAEKIEVKISKNGIVRTQLETVYSLKNEDITPILIMNNVVEQDYYNIRDETHGDYIRPEDRDEDQFLIYDEKNKHFDVIKGEIKLCDNIKIGLNGTIFKNNEKVFTCGELQENNVKNIYADKYEYIFFDYETVVDLKNGNVMKEYSLSFICLNDEELIKLEALDCENNEKEVREIKNNKCITFKGYDCTEKFINWIIENQQNKIFCFVGFNNSNFDNFILLSGLLKNQDITEKNNYRVSDIFYNGSSLLNFKLNGRHHVFDIHKHLVGSLDSNCKAFKIKSCAKKKLSHYKYQQLFDNDELLKHIETDEELKEYNEFDVLSTAVLFQKYRMALMSIESTKKYANKLVDKKTIGSLIYSIFVENREKKNFKLPKLKYDHYKDILKYKCAGRVELFNGVQKVNERLVSTDVCSLYPYIMGVHDCYYPTGEIVETTEYISSDDKIGFYYCNIDQSNLKAENLPLIYPEKTEIENNWAHDKILKNYLISNVMIDLLLKYNCKVEILNGFYFTDKMKSCQMFDFINNIMKSKNEQDELKQRNDVKYNPALRETNKLLMNSLSGKVIEGLHCEKTLDVDSLTKYYEIKDKAKSLNTINLIGNKVFLTYEIDDKDIINEQRPIYLGVLIYDYAKRYMFNYSYSKIGLNNLLYTDTDASKFRYRDFINWKKWIDENNVKVPHWPEVEEIDARYKTHKIFDENSKVFGSFEDELAEMQGDEYIFYCLEKKSWLYGADKKTKFKFKGINDNSKLLTLEEDFIKFKLINHKNDVQEVKYYLDDDTKKIMNFYENTNGLSHEKNAIEFFEKVYSEGEAFVLCSSFRKIVKNSKRNVEVDDTEKYNNLFNSIQVNYNIKHITLKI